MTDLEFRWTVYCATHCLNQGNTSKILSMVHIRLGLGIHEFLSVLDQINMIRRGSRNIMLDLVKFIKVNNRLVLRSSKKAKSEVSCLGICYHRWSTCIFARLCNEDMKISNIGIIGDLSTDM